MSIKERTKKLKMDIPAVFIALSDKDTPLIAKVLAGVTVGYALSPIDLIPDFIPLLGYLDDVIILPLLVAMTVKCIPDEVWEKSKEKALICGKMESLKDGIMQSRLLWYGLLLFGLL